MLNSIIFVTFFFSDVSFSQLAKDVGYEAGQQLAQGAVQYLLEQVGLTDFFKTKCDRKRGIYDPSVVGWNNSKLNQFIYGQKNKKIMCYDCQLRQLSTRDQMA